MTVGLSNQIPYGTKLDDIKLSATATIPYNGEITVVNGYFEWETPDKALCVGQNTARLSFHSLDENISDTFIDVPIIVRRANVIISEMPARISYESGQSLGSSEIVGGKFEGENGEAVSGTIRFLDEEYIPKIGETDAFAEFIPESKGYCARLI